MALVRFNPWFELDRIQRQLDQIFDDTAPSLDWNRNRPSEIPAVEMKEEDHAIGLKIELPGINPDDVDIQVSEDAVSIAGERKSESKTESEGVVRSEFRYGSFRRVIPLPSKVKNADVSANYNDGILHLTLPKSDADRKRVVKVSLNGQATQALGDAEGKAEAETSAS